MDEKVPFSDHASRLGSLAHPSTEVIKRVAALVGYIGCAGGYRYRVRAESLFAGIPLVHSRVLDIGCGTGAWAIWAALHGADHVVGIEPESHGSSPNTLHIFEHAIKTLALDRKVTAANCHLDELPEGPMPFDIAVMYNVINHLDEDAVTILHRDETAFERYVNILRRLRMRVREGGWVIVADCARDNFWVQLGLASPFAPSIEWQKHQNPETWINVFEHSGFRSHDVRWSPLQPFPQLTSNWFAEYLTCSHFVLRVRATDDM